MIIAISGKSGCGNSSVSRQLAKRLDYAFINYTFRNYAEEHGLRFEDIHALAKEDQSIDKYIDEKQIQLSQAGNCVIGSRLAIWKIPHADVRVYLHASLVVRAERIANREKHLPITSFIRTLVRDIRDRKRYRSYYNIDINKHHFVDIAVDTVVNNTSEVVDIIVKKVKSMS